jgi:hypothetical protein
MTERDERAEPGEADGPGPAESAEGMPEFKPIPPEMYRGPGGCGFTGCMYAVMIFAALALALLVIGLLTREWTVPMAAPR